VTGSFCLIVNPAAGGGRSLRACPSATTALDTAGASWRVTESGSLDHARQLADVAARRGEVVVAVGGDGLAGALAGVVAAVGGRYGIIPAGRGNDLARALGIPAAPAAAAAVLTGGRPQLMDLIGVRVDGRPEAVVAGSVYAGIPALAGEIANATRWLTGPAVYPVAALRALARWRPAGFEVRVQSGAGRSFPGYAVVVANIDYFGAGMRVAPPALADDGMLDVVLMRYGPRLAFVRALTRIRNGSHVSLPRISLDRGTEVTLAADRAIPCAADGEPLPGAAPLPAGAKLRIRVLPAALTVLAPGPGDGPGDDRSHRGRRGHQGHQGG
jgi:diacylglycerol kinase (ATP)